MDVALAKRIETTVERASSALLGGAIGYAVYAYFSITVPQPQLGALSGGAAAIVYVLCVRALRAVGPATRRYPVAIFDLRQIDLPMDELLRNLFLQVQSAEVKGASLNGLLLLARSRRPPRTVIPWKTALKFGSLVVRQQL